MTDKLINDCSTCNAQLYAIIYNAIERSHFIVLIVIFGKGRNRNGKKEDSFYRRPHSEIKTS